MSSEILHKARSRGWNNDTMSPPKEGARGLKNKDKPRDKVVRVTSDIYNEMLNSELGRKIRLASLNADFHDVLSEVWDYYKEKHRKEK